MEIVFFPLRCLPSYELVSEVVIVESYGYGWLLHVLVVTQFSVLMGQNIFSNTVGRSL